MEITRRQAIVVAAASGLAPLLGLAPYARADDKHHALHGKWHVKCPDGHVDIVTDGTKQHKCEKCGKQCFVDGKVTVVCPSMHDNVVDLKDVDVLETYKCKHKDGDKEHGKECEGW